jgi:glycerophosphoryl diester phosphodiesterase
VTLAHWPYPGWIAHRGAGKLAPENTLAAFRLGAHHGYRMFECDVKLSQDGTPFLLHDATLERTTNGQGVAGELPWHALASLDAGSWHSREHAGEPIPGLEGIARYCLANDHLLNIEIKPTPGQEHQTGTVVARHAERLWRHASVQPLLTSFEIESLRAAAESAPGLPRGLLLDQARPDWLTLAVQLGCVAIVCNYRLWNSEMVHAAHLAGLRCLSYTVNDIDSARHLQSLGTDGIITDRVDLFPAR